VEGTGADARDRSMNPGRSKNYLGCLRVSDRMPGGEVREQAEERVKGPNRNSGGGKKKFNLHLT